MFCFKKIVSYLDYYVKGEKKRSCGYAKLLVKDENVTVEIQVKGIGTEEKNACESSLCEIWTEGAKKCRIGRFVIDQGTGYYNACHPTENIDGSGFSIFEVCGFRLVLPEENYCLTSWEWGKLPAKNSRSEPEAEAQTESGRESKPGSEAQAESGRESKPEAETQTESGRESKPEAQTENGKKLEADVQTESRTAPEAEADAQSEEVLKKSEVVFLSEAEKQQEPLYEDKWKQLCSTYPVCHPFGEDEEYIAITLKDFVVLRKEYQNLVSNSFLLHSFYNYHHVILGKMGDDEEIYYIGAPGNYFEREKRVAVMFGFEGFARSEAAEGKVSACNGRSGRSADGTQCGDFGYYMKKVEI